jgi:uncharacterized protein YcbK (DUF882 family)
MAEYLTPHFQDVEMKCSCGCNNTIMNTVFMVKLEEARVISDTSYTITSGFRCLQHPESIKRPTSSHTMGRAADIHTPTSRKRSLVLEGLREAGFNRIGIGESFVHVDDDPDKEPHLTWTYY